MTGTVDPNGPDAHYYFEYGTTTSYGSTSPSPPGADTGYGTAAVPASATAARSEASTTYHYRIVANSWSGTSYGEDETFTTTGWTIETASNPGKGESDVLKAVSCASTASCTATGYYETTGSENVGLAEHWTGSSWEVQSTPKPTGSTGELPDAVSCSTDDVCSGRYFENAKSAHFTLADRWNGSSWATQTTPAPAKNPRRSRASRAPPRRNAWRQVPTSRANRQRPNRYLSYGTAHSGKRRPSPSRAEANKLC